MADKDWKLVVHGGAGIIERARMSADKEREVRAGLGTALDAGSAILESGGNALDAVEAAARILEDDPNFNAARGAAFTWDGTHALDAAIMDGRTREAGAAAGVTATRNPVSLARRVMEQSPHVLLAGMGADAFSREQGLEQAPPEWFAIEERRAHLEELKVSGGGFDAAMRYGTVGAVALDKSGHVAAATSTGGVTGKRWGRVGDSPLIGAGTYADDRACAVSATGSGEAFIKACVAHEIAARIRHRGESAQAAVAAALAEVAALGGSGGVIVVTPLGEALWAFNAPGMYRAKASGEAREIAIFADE